MCGAGGPLAWRFSVLAQYLPAQAAIKVVADVANVADVMDAVSMADAVEGFVQVVVATVVKAVR